MNVTHIAMIEAGPRPRYRVKQMLFIPHPGRAQSNFAKMTSKPPRGGRLGQFAELLAEGLEVGEAAETLGFAYSYGNALLQRIRCKLGSQAV